jgi:L-ascorbate metabolism protein UlaG (beta-lactamase superfamily)
MENRKFSASGAGRLDKLTVTMSADGEPGRGGPPRAGRVIAAIAALTVLLIYVGTRKQEPPKPIPGNHQPPPANLPGPVSTPGAPANAPPANPANRPRSNAPAGNAPGLNGLGIPLPGSTAPPRPGGTGKAAVHPAPRPNANELPPGHPAISTDAGNQVSIQWLGYSCFYIYSPGGVTVVTDPFDPRATGLAPPRTGAHFVTISRESPEHNSIEEIHAFPNETRQVVRGAEARRGDLHIVPVPTSGDSPGDRNTAYLIEAGNLRIAHLGDVSHPLSPAQLQALGPVDVLMLPVGESRLRPKDAVRIAKQVHPRMVIPMAYSTSSMGGAAAKLRPLQAFVAASPYAVTPKDTDIIMVSKADLPAGTEIVTLRYQR